MQDLETCAASLCIGLSLGFIGAGGSIFAIPVFVYILKKDPASSGVYSMFVVGLAGIAGSIQSIANRLVDFRVMLMFGIPSVTGVFIARRLIFPNIPDELCSIGAITISRNTLLMLSLSFIMFFAAWRMLKPVTGENTTATVSTSTTLWLLLRGLFVGIATGLLGIGGGFLIVPALYFLTGLTMKKAIGTALPVIAINSSFGFVSSYASVELDWMLLLKFSLGAILGILIGTRLANRIPGNHLKKVFGWCILTLAFYILCRQFFL